MVAKGEIARFEQFLLKSRLLQSGQKASMLEWFNRTARVERFFVCVLVCGYKAGFVVVVFFRVKSILLLF